MIEAAIVALLLATPAVTNLVAQRVVPAGKPQALAYPYVTYSVVSDIVISHTNMGDGNLREARIQFDCWGETLLQAAGVADVLGPVLSPERKPNEPVTPLWVSSSCLVQNGREAQRITFEEKDVAVPNQPSACPQRIAIDFRFQYHRL